MEQRIAALEKLLVEKPERLDPSLAPLGEADPG